MPTYITLIRYTQKGIENIRESPKRLDNARKAFEAAGAKFKDFYLTMGRYDAVTVVEAPSDEVVAKLILQTAALGNVQTETLRAYTESEFRKLIAELP